MFVVVIVHALPGDAIDALVPPDASGNPGTRAVLEKVAILNLEINWYRVGVEPRCELKPLDHEIHTW
jgi:hypothetical protein